MWSWKTATSSPSRVWALCMLQNRLILAPNWFRTLYQGARLDSSYIISSYSDLNFLGFLATLIIRTTDRKCACIMGPSIAMRELILFSCIFGNWGCNICRDSAFYFLMKSFTFMPAWKVMFFACISSLRCIF